MRPVQERSFTIALPNNAGPAALVQRLNLSDRRGVRHLEGWIGNFGSSNVYLFDGAYTVTQCQQLIEQGLIDCLMCLTASGPTSVRLPTDCRSVTVFFEAPNNSGQYQAVTFRVVLEPLDNE